jgi:parallel beta-helix repeat protein
VAGIESENSTNVEIYENEAFDNTGGILVFDLPGLTRYGSQIKVYKNRVYRNNLDNFAPPGNIVGIVPPGTGLLILATREVEVSNNDIIDNKTIGLGIVSYELVAALQNHEKEAAEDGNEGTRSYDAGYKSDKLYDPYPGALYIHDNRFKNSHTLPHLSNEFGKLFLMKFGLNRPDIAWDGILPKIVESQDLRDYYRICISESDDVKIANLDAGNNFNNLSTDRTQFKCEELL